MKLNSYVINGDSILLYFSKDEYYCIGYMKNYDINKIYYGWVLKNDINIESSINKLSEYIGKWDQDDGSRYKFVEISVKNSKLYINMEVDYDIDYPRFYTNDGYIDFDVTNHQYKALTYALGSDTLTNCYYNFFKYNDYLVVVDYNYKNTKCVVSENFNISGIYRVSSD